MSVKIIVHKFETGVNLKSLLISIQKDETKSPEIKFGKWLDGRSFYKKKENEKSSRLVVKIVSGSEDDTFNLDSCAKLINNVDTILEPSSSTDLHSENHITHSYKNDFHNEPNLEWSQSNNGIISCRLYKYNNENTISINNICPLESSLEKVKENNARIMENIHMLNRTLNYTKKKEILDMFCPKSIRTYPCTTCGKCFVYETGLKRHCVMRHSILETQPRWQVVWTCIECFQVWPQYELALKHANECCGPDSTDFVREIKTSSLLQCEFCERVFTSIPRLIRHAKIHTTNKNYECASCSLSFNSYKAAEDHWFLCPWLKTYYGFSLPKLLLCNACDRKFRTYDQLYNHRYKTSHFMAKINSGSLGTFFYQCELCGNIFSTITLLQVHRKQNHPYHDITTHNFVENFNENPNNYIISGNDHDSIESLQ